MGRRGRPRTRPPKTSVKKPLSKLKSINPNTSTSPLKGFESDSENIIQDEDSTFHGVYDAVLDNVEYASPSKDLEMNPKYKRKVKNSRKKKSIRKSLAKEKSFNSDASTSPLKGFQNNIEDTSFHTMYNDAVQDLKSSLKNNSCKVQERANSFSSNSFSGLNKSFVSNVEKILGNTKDGKDNENAIEDKDDIFDKLFNDVPKNLSRNIKTYAGKKKEDNGRILQFEDCKNREEIIQWLSNTQNAFDRQTQTQQEFYGDSQPLLDLPSVSQQSPKKTNHPTRKKHKSPYKLRAKSLELQKKKNLVGGRSNKMYSFGGDSAEYDNYKIEQFTTEGGVTPAEEIIDLMEHKYLENIERELLCQKAISGRKKHPKPLDVVIEPSPKKSDFPCYDYDVLENYFQENMDKLLNEKKDCRKELMTDAQVVGNNFLIIVKKILEGQGSLQELQPLFSELSKVFHVDKKHAATQTCFFQNCNKAVQTTSSLVNNVTQTEIKTVVAGVQTELKHSSSVEIQTDNAQKSHKMVQTEGENLEKCPSEASTASDLVLFGSKPKETAKEEEDVFDDDLEFDFNTEDFMKGCETAKKQVAVSKGVKRLQSPLEVPKSKRPCAKFIQENLTVDFNSCPEEDKENLWDEKSSKAENNNNLEDYFLTSPRAASSSKSIRRNLFGEESSTTLTNSVKPSPKKITILENVIVKEADVSQASIFTDFDVIESTQSPTKPSADVTLPPPVEFQDTKLFSPVRPVLAPLNKVTSTPLTQRGDSESLLSISPIKWEDKKAIAKKLSQRNLGKAMTPLNITKRPYSQQKTLMSYVTPEHKSESFEGFAANRKPCVACSRLSKEQIMAISALANRKLVSFSHSFTPRVTHLVVNVDQKNHIKDHTIKYLSAVAAGAWVLSFAWVQECLKSNKLLPEEPFEVLDIDGAAGPRLSRVTRSSQPLLKGFKVHAAPPFVSTTREEIENVVRLLGGKVAPSSAHLLDKNGYVCVVITEAKATQDFEIYETLLEALKVLTVDLEWLSKSVGQYKLLSLLPFTLCSEENIDSLGYPPELTLPEASLSSSVPSQL